MTSPLTPRRADWQTAVAEPSLLGESPFWHPHEQRLYWVDIGASEVCRMAPKDGSVQRWALAQTPGCVAPCLGGGLVLGLADGLYRAAGWGETPQRLWALPPGDGPLRFNDGKADPLGRFWAGTYALQKQRPGAALYCLDPADGGRVREMHRGFFSSNGLAWSPDARTLYWADTQAHRVLAWPWDAQANLLGAPRVVRQFAAKPADGQPGTVPYGGRPDGAAVDASGHYWCAMYEGAQLLRIAPTGEVVDAIAVPAMCPTMPCFGGDDLRTLYLTTARQNRPADELARLPASGCVLALRVDTPGLPVNFFSG